MARGCAAQFQLASADTAQARHDVKGVLEEAGFRVSARGRTDAGFRMSGIRGSQLAATLLSLVPIVEWFGLGARLGVRVRCQRSLSEGDDRLFLWLSIQPVQEFADDQETWLTSDPGEAIGDHWQSKRIYREVCERLVIRGIVVPFSSTAEGPRARSGSGRRPDSRSGRRR